VVVRIKTGKNIRGALSYNEQKVKTGKAELIMASRFGCELPAMGFSEKLERFERLNKKCKRAGTNTLHLSLNFSPHDQLSTERMQEIAMEYMKRIGFGDQPFLVYRHDDTNHPHLHIVTSCIKSNGRAINMHMIGKKKSEPARKALEQEFNLIAAQSMKKEASLPLYPAAPVQAQYGHDETKRVISNIVREVTSGYHFTSLDELNAILKQFNVIADPGLPGTKMRENGGLVYSILDQFGKKVGVPIKASAIYTKPTLSFLNKKFKNELPRKHLYTKHASQVLAAILSKPEKVTDKQLSLQLAKRKIQCDFFKDEQGNLVDIRFVDHFSKTVLECQDINIPLAAIKAKLRSNSLKEETRTNEKAQQPLQGEQIEIPQLTLKLLKGLLETENPDLNALPESLKRKRKKRRPGF